MVRGIRTFVLVSLLALPVVAGATALPAGSLPDQAAPTGEDHAQTHGPDPVDLDRRGRRPSGGGSVAAAPYDVDAYAAWVAGEWSGAATTDQADVTTLPQFHAIYLYPSNGTSRLAQFGAMFQADARQASQRLSDLYGKQLRWDDRTDGKLDITAVRSSSNAKKLASGNQFSVVRNELISKGFNKANKKYVVWLDAGSNYCGQGELYQDTRRSSANNNELRTTAIVYRPYVNDAATGGFCRGRTLMHEMGHNLGAVQRVAPHAFDGAHCDDSAEDVMCYTSATSLDTGGIAFDHANDDYWDPSGAKLPWWTVNLSKYVCPAAGCLAPATPNY